MSKSCMTCILSPDCPACRDQRKLIETYTKSGRLAPLPSITQAFEVLGAHCRMYRQVRPQPGEPVQ